MSDETTTSVPKAEIGVTGLAVMGSNLARNFARNGFVTAVHNRTQAKTAALVEQFGDEGTFVASASTEEFVASLATPRKIIIMVKAGAATDAVIDELSELLEPGDILIDGGNSKFSDTIRREAAVRDKGIHFVGCGISGGEEGALLGPSIMPGGTAKSYESLGPILEKISAHVDGGPLLHPHRGERRRPLRQDGAQRHRVRRHATDRRGLRPAAERRRIRTGRDRRHLRRLERRRPRLVPDRDHRRSAQAGRCRDRQAVRRRGGRRSRDEGHRHLDRADRAGPGRAGVRHCRGGVRSWPLLGRRPARGRCRTNCRARDSPWEVKDRDAFVEDVRTALYASKIVAYAQGFDEIAAGATEYGWDIDRGAVARIWRGGCIIRARFLNRITEAYESTSAAPLSLLLAPYFTEAVANGQAAWRRVVAGAAQSGIPTPGFGAALAYYDGLRSERLPAALIQGQRDFFGAHTYKRIDRDGAFHTLWSGDRTEIEA